MAKKKPAPRGRSSSRTIDDYIAEFPAEVQKPLRQLRAAIRASAPKADETISYGIAAFRLDGRYLIYFAGFKNHVSVYPAPVGVPAWKDKLAPYAAGKGTVRFSLEKPIPVPLVRALVRFRMKDNEERAKARRRR